MQPSKRVQKLVWGVVVLLATIGVAVAVRRTVALVPTLVSGYAPPTAPSNPVVAQFAALDDLFARYPALTLVHIIPGLLFMVLGPLQFSRALRARRPGWHRWAGRVYLVCALVVGVSALAMSLGMPAIGGAPQAVATTLFGVWFLYALGRAYRHILRREVARHREWMLRAFAVGLAVATIRPIIGLFFATSRLSGLTAAQFFGVAFWVGFVLHVVAAELWIRRTRPQRHIRAQSGEQAPAA